MKVLDRTQSRIPQPWRTVVDWSVTVAVAFAFVLAFQAQVAKPYRIPSLSMEPTLHCAKPTAFCEGRFSDRVIANRLAYRFTDPKRGQIVVFRSPEMAQRCGLGDGGSTFVKRIVGLPGEIVSERDGSIYISGDRLAEPYVDPSLRGHENGRWRAFLRPLLRPRRQPHPLLRLTHMGNGAPTPADRAGDAHVLAAQPPLVPLAPHRSGRATTEPRLRRAKHGGGGNPTRARFDSDLRSS
jgi:signal peptidase I